MKKEKIDKKILLQQRLKLTRRILQKKKASILFISNPINITYLTGLTNSTDREAFLLVSSNKAKLFIFPLRFDECKTIDDYQKILFDKKNKLYQTINKLLSSLKKKEIVFEAEDLRVAELHSLEKKIKAKFKPSSGLIENLRLIKDEWEISSIKKACRITQKTWQEIKPEIIPGKTEKQIAEKIITKVKDNGAQGIPREFEPIVASGINSAIPHHIASNKKIKIGDVVLVDFGCTLDGYCSDLSRTIQIGKESKEVNNAKKAVTFAYKKALNAVRRKQTIREIDRKVKKSLSQLGFKNKMTHTTGHGIGLEVHEIPSISHQAKKNIKLKPGMVITIEPGIYLPGKFGVRYENTILVTKSGVEILTNRLS